MLKCLGYVRILPYYGACLLMLAIINLHFFLASVGLTKLTNVYIPLIISVRLSIYFIRYLSLAFIPLILPIKESHQSLSNPCAFSISPRNCNCLFSIFLINSLFIPDLPDASSCKFVYPCYP